MASAAVGMIWGAFDGASPAPYRLALGGAVLASLGLLLVRRDVSARVLEIVRQDGYDDGYDDGCEVRRESVLRLAGSSGRSALDGAAQKLGS